MSRRRAKVPPASCIAFLPIRPGCEEIPPIPVGGYISDGERLGVPDMAASAYAAAVAVHGAQRAPCSNTGRILPREAPAEGGDLPAFVDYLSLTLKGLRRVLTRIRRQRPEPDGLDDLRAVLFDASLGGWDITERERAASVAVLEKLDCTGCVPMERMTGSRLDRGMAVIARTMLQSVAPGLMFGELTGRGVNGYTDHLKIYTHHGEKCGHIAVGGNAETVHVDLTGQACSRVNMPALADALRGIEHSIGRLDAAWDDFTGRYGTPRGAYENFLYGGFTPVRGQRSKKVQFIDDGESGAGCTFYLGNRTGRLLRIYSKGQQLGNPESPWTRYEIEYRGAEFGLSLDHLRSPGVLLTQYPDLEFLPVDGSGQSAMRAQREAQQEEAEIAVARVIEWATVVCGPVLSMLSDSVGASMTADLIRNEKVPKRLRKIGDSRTELAGMLGDALLGARKHKPIARTSAYLSAEQREKPWTS